MKGFASIASAYPCVLSGRINVILTLQRRKTTFKCGQSPGYSHSLENLRTGLQVSMSNARTYTLICTISSNFSLNPEHSERNTTYGYHTY